MVKNVCLATKITYAADLDPIILFVD